MKLVILAAVAENGVIGRADGLPWRLKSDLKHFRARTWGKPVVMGRKTHASIGRPLPGRTNIVVSRDRDFCAPGIVVAPRFEAALKIARADALRRGASEIAVIGGGEIYAQSLPMAEAIAMTLVHLRPEGDIVFPPVDPKVWEETERIEHSPGPGDDAPFAFVTYRRRASSRATESRA